MRRFVLSVLFVWATIFAARPVCGQTNPTTKPWPPEVPKPPAVAPPITTHTTVTTDPAWVRIGEEIVVSPGVYLIRAQQWNNIHDVFLRGTLSADGKNKLTHIGILTDKTHHYTLNPGCARIKFQDIDFLTDHPIQSAIGVRGKDISVINCDATVQPVQVLGVNRALIDRADPIGIINAYGFTTSPGLYYPNKNIVLQNFTSLGSVKDHCMRCWDFDHFWVIDNDLTNLGGPGQTVNLRSGHDAYIVRLKSQGSLVVGPLQYIQQPESAQVTNVWFVDSVMAVGAIELPPGAVAVHFIRCTMYFPQASGILSFRRSVEGRPMATVSLDGCTLTGKRVCFNQSSIPMTQLLTAKNTTFNGKPLVVTPAMGW